MKSNWQKLKTKCVEQNQIFKELVDQKKYSVIHYSHYDWWAFPLDRNSSYGDQYKVFRQDYQILSKDKQFIEALRSNAILVCKAWGFDLERGEDISIPQQDQKWNHWAIRLYKMSGSLQLFQQDDLLANSVIYAKRLIAEDCDFTYGPKDLKPYYSRFGENWIKQAKKDFNYYKNLPINEKDLFSLGEKQESPNQPKQQQKLSRPVDKEQMALQPAKQVQNIKEQEKQKQKQKIQEVSSEFPAQKIELSSCSKSENEYNEISQEIDRLKLDSAEGQKEPNL